MAIWAILPAAGTGQRMGASVPKQYLPLAGKSVIEHSIESIASVPGVEQIIVALHPEDEHFAQLKLPLNKSNKIVSVDGGDSRQQSVLNGLLSLESRAEDEDWVLVHDAVRPCVLSEDIERLLGEIQEHQVGGLLATPQDNTLKLADGDGHATETIDRSQLWQALTPQVFKFGMLKGALQESIGKGRAVTDEASAMEAHGFRPLLVAGDRNNIKLTRESDLHLAEAILKMQQGKK